jgi:hypothetical protein
MLHPLLDVVRKVMKYKLVCSEVDMRPTFEQTILIQSLIFKKTFSLNSETFKFFDEASNPILRLVLGFYFFGF